MDNILEKEGFLTSPSPSGFIGTFSPPSQSSNQLPAHLLKGTSFQTWLKSIHCLEYLSFYEEVVSVCSTSFPERIEAARLLFERYILPKEPSLQNELVVVSPSLLELVSEVHKSIDIHRKIEMMRQKKGKKESKAEYELRLVRELPKEHKEQITDVLVRLRNNVAARMKDLVDRYRLIIRNRSRRVPEFAEFLHTLRNPSKGSPDDLFEWMIEKMSPDQFDAALAPFLLIKKMLYEDDLFIEKIAEFIKNLFWFLQLILTKINKKGI